MPDLIDGDDKEGSRKAVGFVAMLTIIIIAVQLYGVHCLRSRGLFARQQVSHDFDELKALTSIHTEPDFLPDQWRTSDPYELVRIVMNTVTKTEKSEIFEFTALHHHVAQKNGTLCGGMAFLYAEALRRNGVPARELQLNSQLFGGNDTHVTVDVLIDNRWVVIDPTFHIVFEQDGRRMSASELTTAVRSGKADDIHPVFLGDVSYPARIDKYYMGWKPLFHNVVLRREIVPYWAKLPIVRYWYGAVFHYPPRVNDEPIRLLNELYFVVVVVWPVITAMTVIAFIVSVARARRHRS